jgi:hypothetical protein
MEFDISGIFSMALRIIGDIHCCADHKFRVMYPCQGSMRHTQESPCPTSSGGGVRLLL